VFVVICSRDGKILNASPEFLKVVGREATEIAGRELIQFLADPNSLHEVEAGRTDRIRLTDAGRGEIEAWVHVTELAAGGNSEKVIIGEALAAGAIGLETLPGWECLNNIEVAVLTENQDGTIAFANTKMLELLGYAESELRGRHWSTIVPHEERRWVEQQLRTRPRGIRNQYETFILTKSGGKLPVIVNARPIMESERYQGTVSTFTDISERKQVETELRSQSDRCELANRALSSQRQRLLELADELAKANEELTRLSAAKSDFVAAVSHDLRTPLTTIIEGASLVEDGTLGAVNEEQQKFLKLAIEDARRLNHFINDILDLSKIESGKITVNRTRVSIAEQVALVQRSYENYIQEKGLKLVLALPEQIPPILCDEGHYHRILMNLLSNAIKFTPAGGSITIQVVPKSRGMVQTSVKDTGVGIPQDQAYRLFGKFEQVKRSGAYHQPGSGLGLSLCKQLVELNGGSIGFESEEHKGSDFHFALPAYDEFRDLEAVLDRVGQSAKKVSSETVLVLFKLRKERPDLDATLAKIAEAVSPRILGSDSLRIFPRPKRVVLASALPEESIEPTFSDLVTTVQKTGISGLSASYLVCPDPRPAARSLLAALEERLELIS
jgi:PAS domain S-box-containing protein